MGSGRLHLTTVNVVITVAIAALTVSFWAFLNRPEQLPPWPARIQGFSFSPMRSGEDPSRGIYPAAAEIDQDLAMLSDRTYAVRTYSVSSTLAEVPRLARAHGLNVALGAWIGPDAAANEAQVTKLIELAKANWRNVVRVIVGNESQLRKDVSLDQLGKYLDRVRAAVQMPVSTAEPWHVWLQNPKLADHVDYVAVHLLPYWEGVPVDEAVGYVEKRYNELSNTFPDKPIVIGEVGWPSNGRAWRAAVASKANEAGFLRRFLKLASDNKYVYYVMEAFDQPWKRRTEGGVGSYWGVYDVDRQPKFAFSEPVVDIPEWRVLAGASVLVAAITLALLLTDSRTLRSRGRSFLAVVAYAAATMAVWVVYDFTRQYLTAGTVIVGSLLFIGMIGVIVVLLAEAHEWAEALWVADRRRSFRPVVVADEELPMVSVHVPAYNEPPRMVIATLDALARLDYPRFEVVVVDNNTKDPDVWQPVQAHCERLGERFRFFHVDPLAGFKAGALNYALDQTDPGAEIVAVIDSDYEVSSRWLRDLAPQFRQPQVAIVQAPQDYRDQGQSAFKAMSYAEYRGFFYIGMVTRNERNAIIQHGTMTMIRRSVLEEVGRWGEWCITEDAELGLRVFEHGYEASYIPKSYGRGLMPDTFTDFKKQRFRWAYGAIQIMRRHLGELAGWRRSRLTRGQRYHFVAGWLPWLADGINLLFNLGALGWSVAMALAPRHVDPPLMLFSFLPLSLFAFKVAKLVYLYRTTVDATARQTVAAALAGLALSHTIALAVVTGVLTKTKPFFRTPKMAGRLALLAAIAAAREEALFAVALIGAALAITLNIGLEMTDVGLWVTVLLIQALPYVAALLVSLSSGMPRLPAGLIGPMGALDADRLYPPVQPLPS